MIQGWWDMKIVRKVYVKSRHTGERGAAFTYAPPVPYDAYRIEQSDVENGVDDNKGAFSNFRGMINGGGFVNMYGVFDKRKLLPSNTLRNSTHAFKGINDNNIAGEGVYFRFVKETNEEMGEKNEKSGKKHRIYNNNKWGTFLHNISGKGSGGGVIYYLPRRNAVDLTFTHVKDQDGGKTIGVSNSGNADAMDKRVRDVAMADYTSNNQTEIAFTDGVGLERISDFFVSKTQYERYKESQFGNKSNIGGILKDYKKININNKEKLTGFYNEVINKVNSMFNNKNLEGTELNNIRKFVFDDILKPPDLTSLNYVCKGTVNKGGEITGDDWYYWFQDNNDNEALKGMEQADKQDTCNVENVIIVSWLKQVDSLLTSIMCNGLEKTKNEWNIEGYKKNMENIEKRKNEYLESKSHLPYLNSKITNPRQDKKGIFYLRKAQGIIVSPKIQAQSRGTPNYKKSTVKQRPKITN
jgi:hypothetical protein